MKWRLPHPGRAEEGLLPFISSGCLPQRGCVRLWKAEADGGRQQQRMLHLHAVSRLHYY
jgi:hypothetical protein